MKRKNIKVVSFIVCIVVFLSTSIAYATKEQDDYIKEYKDNIYHMSKMMRCISRTGDVNLDYLYEMAMFSEGEVEFSEAYIKYGKCDDIKKLANCYIEREKIAIDNIKIMIESIKESSPKDEEIEEVYLKIYNDELNKMVYKFQKVELTEDIDTNFLKFICVHHEGVKSITEEFLKLSNNSKVREVAYKLNDEIKYDLDIINKII